MIKVNWIFSALWIGLQSLTSLAPANPVKNVILMISDGCGYNHIQAADYYEFGVNGKQIYQQFPVQCAVSTYSIGGEYNPELAWRDFKYVEQKPTDSAAASTAMSTGVKTSNGAINVDATETKLLSLVERFEAIGKTTGVITTVPFSHATPAGMVAHNRTRNNYQEIAAEMIQMSGLDVIIGAGHPFYDDFGRATENPEYKYVGGESVWNALVNGTAGNDADGDQVPDKWRLIETRAAFQQIAAGTNIKRLIGIPQVRSTLQQKRAGAVQADPFVTPRIESVPTLTEMSLAGLTVLNQDPDGFFVMIEGGAIDWASHDNQSGRMIEEQVDFNRAVAAVYHWVEKNSNWEETLLIITSDHECGYLTGPGSGKTDSDGLLWKPIMNRGQGKLPGMEWHSGQHTNQLIPLFALGAGSEKFHPLADQVDSVRGKYIDNTEIARVIIELIKPIGATD
jgi:alkaline phosphatase